nr:exosortase/archaeosortase family protein [Kibdelosporangium sp. MJ126-NF4]CEL15315.1 hypothetical protein [Kibdelosporangium sp. MJ126-NF4]CTQ95643.1 hypothetical protein [Kibdelosporangium sp. MJ126-NF4]
MTTSAVHARPRRLTGLSTAAFGLTVLLLAVTALYYQYDIRVFEARAAAAFFGLFGASGWDGTIAYAWLDELSAVGLNITPECTVALLGLPVLITVVVLAWRRRISRTRLVMAGIVGIVTVFVGNQVRLAAIAFATKWWGLGFGFDFSHQVLGSVISLITACVGVLVVVWLATRGTRKER